MTGDLISRVYTPAAATMADEQTVTADAHTSACHIDVTPANGKNIIVYRTVSTTVKIAYILATGLLAGAGSGFPAAVTISEDPEDCIMALWCVDSGDIWLAWHNTSVGLRGAILYNDFTVSVNPTTLDSDTSDRRNVTGSIESTTQLKLWYEHTAAQSYNQVVHVVTLDNPGDSAQDFDFTDVNVGADSLTITAHGFETREQVVLTTSGGAPGGLTAGTEYHVIYVDDDTIQLATTPENATAGTDITLTTQGTGTHTLTPDGLPGANAVFARGVGLAAKAFAQSTETCAPADYVPLVHDSTLQATYFLADTNGVAVSKMRPLQGGGLTAKPGLPDVITSATSIYRFACLSKHRLVSADNNLFTLSGVWESEFDFTGPPQHYNAQIGENLLISGGVVYAYDGLGAVEHGFHLFPENVTAVAGATGGSMSDGTYQHRVVYEWTDNKGQVHRSAPSPAVTTTISAGSSVQKITVTIPTLRLTGKTAPRGEVSLVLYRTQDALTTFYRVTSVTSPTYNDPTVDTVAFVDTLADASIAANELLYTTGGFLENIGAPSTALLAVSKNRAFLAGTEDGYRVLFSKRHQIGEAAAFNDALEIRLSSDGGRETAIAVMDGRLIIFRETRIEHIDGDGPDDTGSSDVDRFSKPKEITSDVGCVNPSSLAVVPNGLVFESAKGIYILTRQLQVQYLGAPVEDVLSGLTITSADLLKDTNEIVFLTMEGPTLVYNYFFDQWSTWKNHAGDDAIVWNGAYHYLRITGPLWEQTPEIFTDSGTGIRLKARTAWLHVAELQGFQRVYKARILGNYRSPHKLVVRSAFDYQSYFRGEKTFDTDDILDSSIWGGDAVWGEVDTVWGGVEDDVYQFEYLPPRQRCQAVQFEIEGFPNSDDLGEGFDIAALSLLVGVKRGLKPISLAKR